LLLISLHIWDILLGIIFKENNAQVTKNPITYQGILTFPFLISVASSSIISSLVLFFICPNTNTTTTSNTTLNILNIIAISFTCSPTIAPLAATCPTDCKVPPINAPVAKVSFLNNAFDINGKINIKTIPVIFTIVIEIPLSLSSASITGAVAAIADEPHTAFPLAIKNLKFWLNPNFFPI